MGRADSSHATAQYRALTGQPYPRDTSRAEHLSRDDHPHLGSIVAASGDGSDPFAFVVIPDLISSSGLARAGQHAGELDPEFDPRIIRGIPELGSNVAKTPRREPRRVVDRYGANRFGRSVLLGRRLVEAGARFVQVNWTPSVDPGWDTRSDGFTTLKDLLLPATDRALSALLDDLTGSGLLDQTLVVVSGEFGRSPRIASSGGRGHWPGAYSILLAGAGIPGGRSYGATDRIGSCPLDYPIGPEAIAATILFVLGVRPPAEVGTPPRPDSPPIRHPLPVLDLWSQRGPRADFGYGRRELMQRPNHHCRRLG